MNSPAHHHWLDSDTQETAMVLMKAVAHKYGFSGSVFAYSPIGWMPSHGPGSIKKLMHVDVNPQILKDWQSSVNEDSVGIPAINLKFDPIRKEMIKNTLPKLINLDSIIHSVDKKYSAMEIRWCKFLYDSNVRNVISVPVQMPPSEYWSLSLLHRKGDPEIKHLSNEQKSELLFFAHSLAHFCVENLKWRDQVLKGAGFMLSPRERDCLKWAADGKSAAATADILGLKVETVRKYIKNALARLDSRTKTQAIIKALKLGLIDLVPE